MAAREVDYLLIGGGLASANCARWLRERGADGEVLLGGREPDPPYNRPDCSKCYLRGAQTREEPLFRPDEWWTEQDIELLTRTSVIALDPSARTATLSRPAVASAATGDPAACGSTSVSGPGQKASARRTASSLNRASACAALWSGTWTMSGLKRGRPLAA